jgi:AFG3 family protein
LLTAQKDKVEKVAQLLLKKEIITRQVRSVNIFHPFSYSDYREDMIELLGKRPFPGRSDDMDKWLDNNQANKSAPPPLEDPPIPAVAALVALPRT